MNQALSNARHPSESQAAYRARLREVNKLIDRYLRAGVPAYTPELDRNSKRTPYRKVA